MNILRHIQRWWRADEGVEPESLGYVSSGVIRHHERHAMTRGVDLPTWKTPKEVAQLRRMERRAALRIVKGA
jgi:hypothetical protein